MLNAKVLDTMVHDCARPKVLDTTVLHRNGLDAKVQDACMLNARVQDVNELYATVLVTKAPSFIFWTI